MLVVVVVVVMVLVVVVVMVVVVVVVMVMVVVLVVRGGEDFWRQMARGLLRVLAFIRGCGQWCSGDGGAAECISNCTIARWNLQKHICAILQNNAIAPTYISGRCREVDLEQIVDVGWH